MAIEEFVAIEEFDVIELDRSETCWTANSLVGGAPALLGVMTNNVGLKTWTTVSTDLRRMVASAVTALG
eukprot:CAMPEP_0206394362 /NCGR_PEP_ID=MMETSP0294-20121207/21330_1 /ASSEMBLY_ACC=CAM_ASM_000327 /TAXON_ID=39354 /ORGANISM="Heterosigma akashiwo, Strain CCMP2393" /LENGTH=68 /DNA_ID=CAMNT_0053848259 /DNA_START=203 /DNA_END=410 /DNA_ORIENTATION=+